MTDRGLLELVAAQVSNLTISVEGLQTEVSEVKRRVIHIENDHGAKLDALFDGYKQNSDKLTRIEEEVSKHDEFILQRIK